MRKTGADKDYEDNEDGSLTSFKKTLISKVQERERCNHRQRWSHYYIHYTGSVCLLQRTIVLKNKLNKTSGGIHIGIAFLLCKATQSWSAQHRNSRLCTLSFSFFYFFPIFCINFHSN